MARTLRVRKYHNFYFHDSVTGKDVVTEKVVDITRECRPEAGRDKVLLLFGRTRQYGRMVKIQHGIAYFHASMKKLGIVDVCAPTLGLSTRDLCLLIRKQAPAV